jgi:hypothetical protein
MSFRKPWRSSASTMPGRLARNRAKNSRNPRLDDLVEAAPAGGRAYLHARAQRADVRHRWHVEQSRGVDVLPADEPRPSVAGRSAPRHAEDVDRSDARALMAMALEATPDLRDCV